MQRPGHLPPGIVPLLQQPPHHPQAQQPAHKVVAQHQPNQVSKCIVTARASIAENWQITGNVSPGMVTQKQCAQK